MSQDTTKETLYTVEGTPGGIGGAHWLIKRDDRFIGHFYPAGDFDDLEDFEAYLTTGDKPPIRKEIPNGRSKEISQAPSGL